ncbi:MAG TPA: DUF6457 domain-containing protein [Nocardioidaceae bacterium]|nr:DUF6457 domain-containing protein [Nocardioidaceae bacterium]
MSLATWTTQLSAALGVELDFEIDDVLDIAHDAAHQVDRPAAPLTTFLIGYAAAMRGGSASDISDCIDLASEQITAEADGG